MHGSSQRSHSNAIQCPKDAHLLCLLMDGRKARVSAVVGLDRSTLDPSRVSGSGSVTRGHWKPLSLFSKTHTGGLQPRQHLQSSKPPMQSWGPLSPLSHLSRSSSQHRALEGEKRMNSGFDGLTPYCMFKASEVERMQ